jgi:hypothetical protein
MYEALTLRVSLLRFKISSLAPTSLYFSATPCSLPITPQ